MPKKKRRHQRKRRAGQAAKLSPGRELRPSPIADMGVPPTGSDKRPEVQTGEPDSVSTPAFDLGGTETKPDAIREKLRLAEAHGVLLTAPTVIAPPVGCAVAFTVLSFDAATDCYRTDKDELNLNASALMRVAGAMRISWDGARSHRIDVRREARLASYQAVGFYRGLDGSHVWITGECELDLRDGSDQVESMKERARSAESFVEELREMRHFISRQVETKAKARAIRQAAGVRAYTLEELRRPFVVPSLVFTGHSDDPEVRKALAIAIGKSMLSSQSALYGGAVMPTPNGPLPPPIHSDTLGVYE